MANQAWVYCINAEEMAAHQVDLHSDDLPADLLEYLSAELPPNLRERVFGKKPQATTRAKDDGADPTKSSSTIPLLEWVSAQLAEGKQDQVTEYLLDKEPGMHIATEFRHDWAPAEALRLMAGQLADTNEGEALRRRINGPYPMSQVPPDGFDPADTSLLLQGAEFPDRFDSPLKALDLQGWRFFARREIELLETAYRSISWSALDLDQEPEWEELFRACSSIPYDSVAFVHSSLM